MAELKREPSIHICGPDNGWIFYRQEQIPVHSVRLLRSEAEALAYPKGDLRLSLCQQCGMIKNLDFDSRLNDYSAGYEPTQAFSPTFNAFHERFARELVSRFQLEGKAVIEVGCGQGEFLKLLTELGVRRGIGFDPAFVSRDMQSERVEIVPDFYSTKYSDVGADFVCCKMTLEHIFDPISFLTAIRDSIGARQEIGILFQVPDVKRILDELAFWDIYYEHCCYFDAESIAGLFVRCGFEVLQVKREFNKQYLAIEAKPGARYPEEAESSVSPGFLSRVQRFSQKVGEKIEMWEGHIENARAHGQQVAIWGAGSKAVSFLTALKIDPHSVGYAVDRNPHKAGTFLAGSGLRVVPPEHLRTDKPDLVVVMNPNYLAEIRGQLQSYGVAAEVIAV